MKRVIAWILLLTLCLGLFAGCKKDDPNSGVDVVDTADLEAALEYVKTVYRKVSETTPKDFQRIGNVPVNGVDYEVVWSADVSEEHIKVVKGEDGMVTIDVNEEEKEDLPYVLTATISDALGNSVSHSWNHILPAAVSNEDMIEIVKAAYALEQGASMGYDVTLTGVITRINTAWSDDYQNITVTIVVAGAEDMPIQCYRLKGDGAKDLKVGDTITVTGELKNYNGTIEFDAGCSLDAVVKGEEVEAPDDAEQILKDAYALKPGESTKYVATLTGKITKINSPYNASYKNVSVTIEVEGFSDYPILCYRIMGDGADSLLIGDTITVEGYIVNYEGTIEFDAGSKLVKVEKTGKEVKAPSDPKQIVKDAYALGEDETLPYKATLTGTITKVRTAYSSEYKNVTVIMVIDGMGDYPIDCYRLAGDGADQIGKGDTITVTGWITNYKGTVQFAQGCTLDSWKDTGAAEPEFVTTVVPTAVDPELGKPYKFFIHQKNTNKYLYLTGKMDGYYYETTLNPDEAVDVYLVAYNGGYRAYYMDGSSKVYLEMTKSGTHNNVIFTTSPSKTLKWNYDINSITCDIEGEDFIWGTYKNYSTFSASPLSYVTGENADQMDVGNFVARFGVLEEVEKASPAEQAFAQLKADYYTDASVTTTTENYTRKNAYTFDNEKVTVVWTENSDAVAIVDNGDGTVTVQVTRGEADAAYTLTATITDGSETYTTSWECVVPAMPVDNDGDVLSIPEANEMGLAQTDGYTEVLYNVSGTITKITSEKYGNMYITDAAGNSLYIYGLYDADENRYDAMTVKPAVGDILTVQGGLGQYNGTPQMKNATVVSHTQVLSLEAANALGAGLTEATTTKYQVSGTVVEITNEKYGNMTITDEKGNVLVIYGTYSADGETRYDAMEQKPAVGDYVALYGVMDQYKGTAQLENGWLVEHRVAATIPNANTIGAAVADDETTAIKYQVTGIVSEIKSEKYGNMYIQDENGNSLYIYGLYDAIGNLRYDAMEVKPAVGDTVTVYGVLCQYKGTAQIKNGWLLEHIVPTTETPVVSIPEANEIGAAVAAGETTAVKYQVTGVVSEIKSEKYGNMYIQDEAGNKLYVYGVYSADGETRYDSMTVKPVVGDIVTLYGVLGQYNGEPQMQSGWLVAHTAVATIEQANTIGAAVAAGETTAVKYQVTGVVSEIKSEKYGNMYIQDETGNKLYIYGVYSADGETRYDSMTVKPVVGDIVTLYGVLGQYNGTPQMQSGWLVAHTAVATIEQANTIGAAVAAGETTAVKYQVTGVVSELKSEKYGNMYIQDEAGNKLYVYGVYSADGETRYDSMTVKPVVGDTVTLYGVLGQYNGTPQMQSGWLVAHTPAGGEEGGEEPAPTPTPNPAGGYTKIGTVEELTAGTYKIAAYATDVTVSGNTTYFTDAPYHFWDGNIGTGSGKKDLITNTYAYDETTGALTKHADSAVNASKNGDAVEIQLVAVEGKANTYYIKYGDQYLSATYDKRALELSATPAEWVAENNDNGGIVMHHYVDSGFVTMGFANAASNMIRSYKDSSGNMNTGIKSGIYFFTENTAE